MKTHRLHRSTLAARVMCVVLSCALASYVCTPAALAVSPAESGGAVSRGSSIPSAVAEAQFRGAQLDDDALPAEQVSVDADALAGGADEDASTSGAVPRSGAPAMGVVAPQSSGIDLNAAWKAQDGGLTNSFTIAKDATYYLSDDLSVGNNLIIDAPGADVVIAFDGHALSAVGSSMAAGPITAPTMVCIYAASSVTFDGASSSSAGKSKLVSAGSGDLWAVSSVASDCTVSMNDLTIELSSDSTDLRTMHTHGIRMAAGSLSLASCTVNMDMGNQALRSTSLVSADEAQSAVYATSDVKSVALTDCAVVGRGTQGFSLSDLSDATGLGNAYALYSLAESTTVAGGSYTAESLRGNATCLYASSLEIAAGEDGSEVKLEADAGQVATGVLSADDSSVTVGAPLTFSVSEEYDGLAEVEALFRSSVQRGFVFGDCAPKKAGATYPALVMTGSGLDEANASGSFLGTFASTLTDTSKRAAVLAALDDALGDVGSCSVASGTLGVYFAFDATKAPASVTSSGGSSVRYPTVADAAAALAKSPGATLTLLKDAGAVTIASATDGTIDLNGHSVSTFEFSADAKGKGLTVRDGSISGTLALDSSSVATVYHHSPTPLTFDGVSIDAASASSKVSAIYAAKDAGALTLKGGTAVQAAASTMSSATVYGINMATSGPSVTVDGSTVSARALSAGVAAYGMYTTMSAVVSGGSTVSAEGVTSTTCASYVGGSFAAASSTFKAHTSGAAAVAAGIWMRVSNPVATDVSVTGCTVEVTADVGPSSLQGVSYACILGATSDTGTVAPTGGLALAGSNTFASDSGVHIGLNVGGITLGNDFNLSGSSESPLVVSQSAQGGNIGFTAGAGSSLSGGWAELFVAKEGSYYDGWKLALDSSGSKLVWRPVNYSSKGIVSVAHGGTKSSFPSFAEALSAARSGDTVTLLADLSESGAQVVSQDSLTIDLGGHELTLRGGSSSAGADGTDGVLTYTGSGTLAVKNGTLRATVGVASEPTAGATYQGIAVSGGGMLDVNSSAIVNVDYTGSASPSAAQRPVTLRGIALLDGSLSHAGVLNVTGALVDGGVGANAVYGVFAEPTADAAVNVSVTGSVTVDARTAHSTTGNTYYAESPSTNGSAPGLREITVDPEVDADFYNDIVELFRASATYDDPADTSLRNNFGNYIYYAGNMALDHDGKWYDGLKVWAYTDEVTGSDVGTFEAMVPSHVFISAYYDTLSEAYGVATGSGAAGKADVSIMGSVSVVDAHGNASALSALRAESGSVSWACSGASLSAMVDDVVHPLAQGTFDLREFIDFKSSVQATTVNYPGTTTSKLVRFEPAKARDAVVGDGVSFIVDGASTFALDGLDTAAIDANVFTVGRSFSLAAGGETCSVANSATGNVEGAVLAEPAVGAAIGASKAALFSDAYGAYVPGITSDGSLVWADPVGYAVTFKVGDAVVARYVEPDSVDLSEVSLLAVRPDDQRQNFELIGWSQSADENATSGYLDPDSLIYPTESAVYHAVYGTSLATLPVTFSNVRDADGTLLPDVALTAEYGSTVGGALAAAGVSLPSPKDYTAYGLSYRFVGWYPYTSGVPVAALTYSARQVADLEVTVAVNGVGSSSTLELRAMYLATGPTQHIITFVVDDRSSSCVVDDGAHPVYTTANNTNTNYVTPSKLVTVSGKTFTFDSWFVDSDGDSVLGAGEESFPAALPRATADAMYTANWLWTWSDISLTFYVKQYDEETGRLNDNGVRNVSTTYDADLQDVADSIAKVGSKLGFGGQVYTLEGWGIRKSDVDPLYDADNPLPVLSDTSRALASTSYSQTYYGMYSSGSHRVTVTFYDGKAKLGSASVAAVDASVNAAFSATGASTPADKSSTEMFLGWSKENSASSALNGTATTIESLVGSTGSALSLYAVYGNAPTYTVQLRSADGSKLLYKVAVRSGKTLNEVLAEKGVTVSAPLQTGKYFKGWCTAAGKKFSLDEAVTGSSTLYATYQNIRVTTDDPDNVSATVSSNLARLEDAASVAFSITKRTSADSPIRYETAQYGYSNLRYYDIRLVATKADGTQSLITGDIGTASITVLVGSAYSSARPRAFWLGTKNGKEDVKHSAAKTVSDGGTITFSIGNYAVGDEDEGGNVAISYVEGGSSRGSLSGDGASGAVINSNSSSTSGTTSGLSSPTSSATLGVLSASLGDSSSTGLSSSSGTGLSQKSGSATAAGADASTAENAVAMASDVGVVADADGALEGAAEEGDASPFAGWDSDATVLIVIIVVVIAAILYGLWRMLVVRQRRSEAEAEIPALAEQYAEGIHF